MLCRWCLVRQSDRGIKGVWRVIRTGCGGDSLDSLTGGRGSRCHLVLDHRAAATALALAAALQAVEGASLVETPERLRRKQTPQRRRQAPDQLAEAVPI